MSIHVGVAYGSDINLVTETLLKATEEVDSVLRDPPPKVQFLKFGDWSLDFRLLVWTELAAAACAEFAATSTIASKDYFARRESRYLFRKPNCACARAQC